MASIRSSAPTTSAPAFLASSALSPLANTATRTSLPVPLGRLTTPRTIWSAGRGSPPRLLATSPGSSTWAVARLLTRPIASSTPSWVLGSTWPACAFCFFVSFAMSLALHDMEAHRASGAFDDLRRRLEVVGVEVLHLRRRDLGQLRALDSARGDLAGLLRARLELGRLLEEEARRRGLGGEGEAAIGIDGDHRRDRRALFQLLRRGVERLAEFHDVDAALAQGRADRRRRVGGASRHLELDVARDFLRHFSHSVVELPRASPDASVQV